MILNLNVETYEAASQLAETLINGKLAAEVEVNEVTSFSQGANRRFSLQIVSEWELYAQLEWAIRKLVAEPKIATLPLMELSPEFRNWIRERLA